MPLYLAVFAPDKAGEVIAAYSQLAHWAVGGHSLGGAMAARFAASHPDQVSGLVLWASYPDNDLSANALEVTAIYGTLDGLATVQKIDDSRALRPADTVFVPVDGGNHAQFGGYEARAGDNAATITREVQQERVVAATIDLLACLSP